LESVEFQKHIGAYYFYACTFCGKEILLLIIRLINMLFSVPSLLLGYPTKKHIVSPTLKGTLKKIKLSPIIKESIFI